MAEKVEAFHERMRSILKASEKLLDLCINAEASDDREKFENCLIRAEDFSETIKKFELLCSEVSDWALREQSTLSAEHYDLEESFDNVAYSIRTKARNLQRLLDKKVSDVVNDTVNASSGARREGTNSHVKLPLIKLPTFSGDITLYQSFIELFNSLIHNKDLSVVEKFHYLVSSLEGEPLSLVKCLRLTAINYSIALDTLNKRYLNNRLAANSYLQTINKLNPISERSSQSLKHVVDQFKENWAAFRALLSDTEDQLNLLVVNILLQKLDVHTREQFELSIVDKGQFIPSVEMLIDFVEKHSLALGNMGLNVNVKPTKFVKKDNKSKTKQSSLSLVVNSVVACPMCNSNHDVTKCDAFLKKTPYERFKAIKNKSRCLNCLSTTHLVKACDSDSVCTKCARKHHSLLHYAKSNDGEKVTPCPDPLIISPVESSTSNGADVTDNSVFAGVIASSSTILLATAVVNILDISGSPVPIRMVIDCGSQVNFISEKCVQRLGLVRTHSSLAIRGLNQQPAAKSRGVTNCSLRSRTRDHLKLVVEAQIISNICSDMPSVTLSTQSWDHLLHLKLADPYFYHKQPIDMLLGAGVFPQILLGNIIPGNHNTPTALDTIFGYILMGKVDNIGDLDNSCLFVENALEDCVKRFWELEQIPSQFTTDTDQCEQHFQNTHYRTPEGRYVVALPFKEGHVPSFGDSYSIALRSPYLALRTLKQLALDESLDFPKASQVLQSHVFVDDVITGCQSIEETRQLAFDLISMLKRGGFELKKIC
ncbi:hypothetical protein NQ317_004248 [Molorchus minor]|uniref:Peptidase aspartic putative domain-containing protein n=1 Tax=Molorchus minor TaxID=1323400 RepID=A0ABQ9K011_9CUCU|nr:hypothetical protein NQ317_004248 [Molorchus minor]